MRTSLATAALAAALLLSSCTPAAPGSGSPTTPAGTTPRPASPTTPVGFNRACDSQLQVTEKDLKPGEQLWAAAHGEGSTAVVLLHQTNGNGMCGWNYFAPWFAEQKVRMVMLDACGYGRSKCAIPWGEQVRLAVDWARSLGSTRVVLIGASMGGTMAIHAAPTAKPDAVVDLSGPASFGQGDFVQDAPKVTVPTLIVFSSDDRADLAKVTAALGTLGTPTKKLVELNSCHGYGCLDLAAGKPVVAKWIAGDYA